MTSKRIRIRIKESEKSPLLKAHQDGFPAKDPVVSDVKKTIAKKQVKN